MERPRFIAGALLAATALASVPSPPIAEEASSSGVPVHVVVTVEPRNCVRKAIQQMLVTAAHQANLEAD
jgi:hypothetical protein